MAEIINYRQLKEKVKIAEESGAETLKADVAEAKKRLETYEKELSKVNTLMFFGFIVLLVMVAALILTAIYDCKNAYNQLSAEKIQLLEKKIELLENQSAKKPPR